MVTKKQPMTAAEALVGNLLSQIKDELNTIQDPNNPNQSVWGTQSEIQQAEILDRCKRRIRAALDAGFTELFADGVASVRANVAGINFKKKGIICTLEVPESSKYRHELADAASTQVLVIITPDIDAYMKSADMVKPDSDQQDLPLNHDEEPAVDELSDARTTKALKKRALEVAKAIGEHGEEKGLDAAEFGTWDRDRLIDYIQYAEQKIEAEGSQEGKVAQ